MSYFKSIMIGVASYFKFITKLILIAIFLNLVQGGGDTQLHEEVFIAMGEPMFL